MKGKDVRKALTDEWQRTGVSDSEIFKGVLEHTDRQIQTLRDSIATLNARIAAYRSLGLDSLLTR